MTIPPFDEQTEASADTKREAQIREAGIHFGRNDEVMFLLRRLDAARLALSGAQADFALAREEIAAMMMRHSIATGHGDTIHDLLIELEPTLARLSAPVGGDVMEIARDGLAPYFATDGEEEDPRIAEAVEGALSRLADNIARAITREHEAAAGRGWRAAVEEAARICDVAMDRAADREYDDLAQQASDCADAIRALADQRNIFRSPTLSAQTERGPTI